MNVPEVLVRAGTMLLSGAAGMLGVTEGSGVAARGAIGNAERSGHVEGLYVGDTRCLSVWSLTVDGVDLESAGALLGRDHRTVAAVPSTLRNVPPGYFIVRAQQVRAGGLTDEISVRSASAQALRLTLRLALAADFADQFEVRSDGRTFDRSAASSVVRALPDGLQLTYRRAREGLDFARQVRVCAGGAAVITPVDGPGARVVGGELSWTIQLEPEGTWDVRVDVDVDTGSASDGPGPDGSRVDVPIVRSSELLGGDRGTAGDLLAQSLADLDSLRMPCPTLPHLQVPAAGVPWFLTLFGRDAVIAALLAQNDRPQLLPDVVEALARTQGTREDHARVEQPGKIVHELRISELAVLGQVPYGRYYGSVDATALYLVALGRLGEGQESLVRELEVSARAAVAWLRGPGGLDEHGFVRYVPDPAGLKNQGWKDSADAVMHADGSLESGAIALCEVQGYTWRGIVEAARLARTLWGDAAWADDLEAVADALRERFRERFWLEPSNFPALALDGEGRQVDVLASNAGHLLWSGILTAAEAEHVVHRLVSEEFFTGWGIRTVAAGQTAFSPLSYHGGSVWPHDTMLAAVGMYQYGFGAEARLLATGIARAAEHFNGHLPELFGGNTAEDFPAPLSYTRAGVPQAWSAAAGAAAARIMRN